MTDTSASADPQSGNEDSPIHFELPPKAPPMRSTPRPAASAPPLNVKKLSGLEDLCAAFPDIGNGEYFLRVERIAPKSYLGTPIAGDLEDLNEKITMADFRRRYGGGRYSVKVIGPYGQPGADGQQPLRQLNDVEVIIPGPPAPNSFPIVEDPMNSGPYHYTAGRGMGAPVEHHTVASRRLDIEHKERMESLQAARQLGQTPEHVVKALSEQNRSTVEAVEKRATAEAQTLREQLAMYAKQISDKDVEIKDLRDQLTQQKFASASAVRDAERALETALKREHEASVRALNDRFESELRHLRETSAKEIASLKETHAAALADTHRRQETALNEASRRYADESTRRNDEDRKAREQLKETFEARISDLKDQQRREIDQIRADREREIASLKATYDNSKEFTQKTADVRLETKEAELVRLRTECDQLRATNEKLRKDSVKDPITYLQEVKQVGTEILGLVPASEAAAAAAEGGEFDWKKEAAKGLVSFVQGLPETVGKAAEAVQNIRAQNQAAAAQQQAMAEQQQYGDFQTGPAQAAPQGGRRRRRMAPPPATAWDGLPPAHAGPVQGAEIPMTYPYAPIPQRQPEQPLGPPVPQQTSRPADPNAPPFGYAGPPPGYAPQQPAQPPQQQQQPQQMTPEQAQQMQQGVETFITELDAAISTDIMPAKMFAAGVVNQIGPASAADWFKKISVEQFLSEIDRIGRGGAITTVEGQKYTREVWAEALRLASSA